MMSVKEYEDRFGYFAANAHYKKFCYYIDYDVSFLAGAGWFGSC